MRDGPGGEGGEHQRAGGGGGAGHRDRHQHSPTDEKSTLSGSAAAAGSAKATLDLPKAHRQDFFSGGEDQRADNQVDTVGKLVRYVISVTFGLGMYISPQWTHQLPEYDTTMTHVPRIMDRPILVAS